MTEETLNQKTKRNTVAQLIIDGASNPLAVVRAIYVAMRVMTEVEKADAEKIKNDPAIRLMVYQLAYLCRVSEFDDSSDVSASCTKLGEALDAIQVEKHVVDEEGDRRCVSYCPHSDH